MATHSGILAWRIPGQRSLAGHSPRGCRVRHDLATKPNHHSGLRTSLQLNCKESACNAGNPGLISGLGRSPGGGHGHPLQNSCLENPMDRGSWQATVCGIAKQSDMTQRLNNNKTQHIRNLFDSIVKKASKWQMILVWIFSLIYPSKIHGTWSVSQNPGFHVMIGPFLSSRLLAYQQKRA